MLQQYAGAMTLLVRADHPRALIGPLRDEVQMLDKDLLTFRSERLTERLRAWLIPQRSTATLLGSFGLLALVLASVGLYGVMA